MVHIAGFELTASDATLDHRSEQFASPTHHLIYEKTPKVREIVGLGDHEFWDATQPGFADGIPPTVYEFAHKIARFALKIGNLFFGALKLRQHECPHGRAEQGVFVLEIEI